MRTLRDGLKYWLALALLACLPMTGRAAMFQVPVAAGGGGSVTTGSVTVLAPLILSGTEIQLPIQLAGQKTNPPVEWATNALWGNFFKYDTNAADYIVSASVTNEPARERLDNFVRQIKRAGLWSTMLDAASMFRYHQDSATTFKTFKGYATSPVNATQTLDDNGVLLDGTPTAAPMFHVPNATNYTLIVAYRTFTNMAVAQSQLIGIFNTNGYTHSYTAVETLGDNYFYLAMAQSNTVKYTNFSFAVTTNAPALHHQDSMRHSAGYWVNGTTGLKMWADGLYSKSNVFANPPTNINMTELILGGYNNAAGSYPDGTFRGYIESWALFDGQLTDEQVKNVDMALRGLAPQRVNMVVEGTSLDAWNGIGFAGDVYWNWPFQLWQNPSVSNSFVVYNHAQAGARLITPTGGFGSIDQEYTNTIQYLRPEKNGGAYGVDKSILVIGPPANDFVDGITAANIYAGYLGYINRATADGFEVWASTMGAAQFMDSTQNGRRTVFNSMLLTNSGLAKRLIRRDLLFPEYMTNGPSYYDGTHLSVTGNVEIARQILNLEGNRFTGTLSTNGVSVGPMEELNVVNGGNLTIAAVNDTELRKVTLTLTGSAGSGGTNLDNANVTYDVRAASFTGSGTGRPTIELAASNSVSVIQGVAISNSVMITNLVGLLHKANAVYIELDCNHGNDFHITNRIAQNTIVNWLNPAQGQTLSLRLHGAAASGSDYFVTNTFPSGWLVANQSSNSAPLAVQLPVSVLDGTGAELNIRPYRLFTGTTNIAGAIINTYTE